MRFGISETDRASPQAIHTPLTRERAVRRGHDLHLQAWQVLSLHIALSLSVPSIPHGQPVYFELTALVADPPRLLRTVMFCGFVGHEN
jgi:hypothetical protein